MRSLLLNLSMIFIVLTSLGQEIGVEAKVGPEPVEDSHCIGQLKEQLITAAKLKAIADHCGTFINSDSELEIGEKVKFYQYSSNQVKGDWIKTTSQKINWLIETEDGQERIYITATVKGSVRCRDQAQAKLEVYFLNSIPAEGKQIENYHTSNFKDRSPFYIYFRSPVKGYISIFLYEDNQDKVYNLLPYKSMYNDYPAAVRVKADKKYFFLSREENKFKKYRADEFILDAYGSKSFQQIYIIFSEQSFKKPIFELEKGLKYLKKQNFQNWLSDNMASDKTFQSVRIPITVSK